VKHTQGFTLVELLITMALLSMIILIGSSAFGMFGQRWDGRLGQFDATMRNTQNIMLVQEVLGSLTPYVAYNQNGKPVIYFEGNRNGFVAVSSKSIYSDGHFSVVRFSVRQTEDLQYDVLYEEAPMDDDILVSINQPLEFSRPMVLFESVNDPLFQYYGWADVRQRDSEDTSELIPPQWLDRYNALDALFAPLKASLNFTNSAGPHQISSRVATQSSGLISRYKSNPQNRNAPVGEAPQDDYCDC
jgi:prepilin-type N-terminal cleavage/methylation domain-containing protein